MALPQYQIPFQFRKIYAGPLSADEVFATTQARQEFLTNARRYAGQVAADLEQPGKLFMLSPDRTEWLEISGGSDLSQLQIAVVDQQLQFKISLDESASWQPIADLTELQGPAGVPGEPGPQGAGLLVKGAVSTQEELTALEPLAVPGDAYVFNQGLSIWDGAAWVVLPAIQGPQGVQGPEGPVGGIGPEGLPGPAGYSLEYIVDGTILKIKREDEATFTEMQLRAEQGFTYRGAWAYNQQYNKGDYVLSRSLQDSTKDSLWFVGLTQAGFLSTQPPHADTSRWVEFKAPAGPPGPQGPAGAEGAGLNPQGQWVQNQYYEQYALVFAESSFNPSINSLWIAQQAHLSVTEPRLATTLWQEYSILTALPEQPAVPEGGDLGQVLTKTSSNNYELGWTTPVTLEQLDTKVNKEENKQLTEANFTFLEKEKLNSLESSKFKGQFANLAELQQAHPLPEAGSYANVDQGEGIEIQRYIWSSSTSTWVQQASTNSTLTALQIKQEYESNLDTNAFTDADQQFLSELPQALAQFSQEISQKADKISIQKNSHAIQFSEAAVYGTPTQPLLHNLTVDLTNAKLGVSIAIFHQSAQFPLLPASFKRLTTSGSYSPGQLNIIYCQYLTPTFQTFSITQIDE